MKKLSSLSIALALAACTKTQPAADAGGQTDDSLTIDGAVPTDGGPDAFVAPCTGTPAECGAMWEQNASDRFDGLLGDPTGLGTWLIGVPKGGDLHNHLTGAVYAETILDWAKEDGTCINTSSFAAVSGCGAGTAPTPDAGTSLFDSIVRAWSMEGFVTGAENGHDHFFATFGKFGIVAGVHRDETIADVVKRATRENQIYVETMFNLAKNVGTLAASAVSGTITVANLDATYNTIRNNAGFATALANDVATVRGAHTGFRTELGCNDLSPPLECDVGVRFIAQVARTGANDQVFGQLIGAFEMAAQTPEIVGANLSSPEDDSRSLNNYNLHMAMLDYLHAKYTVPGTSPLHVTLHAGEVVPQYLPPGSTDNTFHIRSAVEIAHAERIGHGVDIMTETDPEGLMTTMANTGVLVEVCLSSNDQILEVSGAAHPLAAYLSHGVPVALATDDQGVSRSSMAGEYLRAALDQHLTYRQLKLLARNSLAHSFLPGASLWTTLSATPMVNTACAPTATMGIGDPANAGCAAFLAASERATIQWELERRFRAFESAQ